MLNLQRLTYVLPLTIKAMAIIENMWLRKAKKRLGGAVLYQAMEQTRARELASSVTNPRTASQMSQRVKWAQLVAFYRANADWMKYAYETKTPQQSEYNKFMQLNVANSQVYFTKQQAAGGSCVVAPYIMTQGSLPSIEFTAESGSWPSNIYYPAGSSLMATTTIAEFSQKIITQNPAIRNGDQLSFIRFTQMFNNDTGNPYVIVRKYELVFNTSSEELVGSYLPLDYIGVLLTGTAPQLGVIDSGLAGGFTLILSRTSGGKTYVSSQRIITTRMDATLQLFGSDMQLEMAIASYGENADAFLSSTTADINPGTAVPLSIVGFEVEGVRYTPGSVVLLYGHAASGDEVELVFNQEFPNEEPTNAGFSTSAGSVSLISVSKIGTHVVGTIPAGITFTEGEKLAYAYVRTNRGIYTAVFA